LRSLSFIRRRVVRNSFYLHEAEACALAALLGLGPQLLLIERLQLVLAHVPDAAELGAQALDIGALDEIAGANHIVGTLPADGENAIADLHQRARIGCGSQRGLCLLGGVADDVLHLLDEHGEHAAERLGVGVVDGQLLLKGLADAAQNRLGDVAAIGENDTLLVQRRPQIHELTGEHPRLL
jgi:hypothetical protein